MASLSGRKFALPLIQKPPTPRLHSEVSPSKSSASDALCLPEIWHLIYLHAASGNEVDAWLQGRRICRASRCGVNVAYVDLLKTGKLQLNIFFDLGMERQPKMQLEMIFDRFENGNAARCIFAESNRDQGQAKCHQHMQQEHKVWQRLKGYHLARVLHQYRFGDCHSPGSCRFDSPPYTISMNTVVNDSVLPGLKWDLEAQEISFNLNGMLDCFCEEALRLNPASVKSIFPPPLLKAPLGSLERWDALDRSSQDIWHLRRIRMQNHYKKHHVHETFETLHQDEDFRERERAALKKIRDRALMSMLHEDVEDGSDSGSEDFDRA